MNRAILCTLLASFVIISAANAQDSFNIPAPIALKPADRIYIWATHYNKHFTFISHSTDAVPLRSKDGQSLGVTVSPRDLCYGAMEGTLVVKDGDNSAVYNADGLAPSAIVNCALYYPHSNVKEKLGSQAFIKLGASAPDGLGVLSYRLVPDRTLAVNHSNIPYGTVLYIPQLRQDGVRTATGLQPHDGYMFAADTGGSMRGCHVDYFTGDRTLDPDPKLTSSKSQPIAIEAYVVHDPNVRAKLVALHNMATTAPGVAPISATACKAATIPPYPKGES